MQEDAAQCYYDHLYEGGRGCDYGWWSKRNRPFRGALKRERFHLILTQQNGKKEEGTKGERKGGGEKDTKRSQNQAACQ